MISLRSETLLYLESQHLGQHLSQSSRCSIHVWILEEFPDTTFLSTPHLITTISDWTLSCHINSGGAFSKVSEIYSPLNPKINKQVWVFIKWSSLLLHPLKANFYSVVQLWVTKFAIQCRMCLFILIIVYWAHCECLGWALVLRHISSPTWGGATPWSPFLQAKSPLNLSLPRTMSSRMTKTQGFG